MRKRENINKMASKQRNYYNALNGEQRSVFDLVVSFVTQPSPGNTIFVTGAAGTGKTFLLNAILGYCEFSKIPYVSVAYTRMGACLLKNGLTVFSRFKMGWKRNGEFSSYVTPENDAGSELYEAQIIVWDQATSCHKDMLLEVDQMLQRLMGNQNPFGGKLILLCGDFCESLPILRAVSPKEVVSSSIAHANTVWPHVKHMHLSENMRFKQHEDFDWLLSVGMGRVQFVQMPLGCYVETESELIDWVFGCPVKPLDLQGGQNRIILTLTNSSASSFNRVCMERMSTDFYIFESSDYVRKLRPNQPSKLFYSMNYFKKIIPKDFPSAVIRLKQGCPIVLKRWYGDLQPGTRLVVSQIFRDGSIKAMITTGPYLGKETTIKRVCCVFRMHNHNLQFRRIQLPIDLCFAMTIQKAQGLTFDHVGVSLSQTVFSHGQLYMALSRVRNFDNLKIWVLNNNEQNYTAVPNCVYHEALGF